MKVKNYVPSTQEAADFDTAICLTGYGKFHYETIAICAICIIAVGFQNGLSSYVFPAAQCELKLTSFELGLLNIIFLLGGILSCFLWGILADINGRRKILATTHLLNALTTLLCAFVKYKSSLIVCRFFNGFFIGAPGAIIFSYFAEFQPPKYRSACVCYCGLFFTSSWLFLPVCAHLILPLNVDHSIGNIFIITPWRLYLILMVIPETILGIWFIRMPESPKFYMAKGEKKKALFILNRMYTMNTGKTVFPVKYLIAPHQSENHNTLKSTTFTNRSLRMLLMMLKQSKSLFKPPLIAVTSLTCCVMFSNMFGIYGLGLWIPEIFLRFKQYQDLHPNDTITLKELSTLNEVRNITCQPSFDLVVIQNTIAMAISSLVYNSVSGILSTKVDTKIITVVSMLLGGTSAGCIYWLRSSIQHLIVACIFQASMVTANMTIGSIGVHLFPTEVSAVALCLIMCAGRVGAVCSNIFFGYLMDTQCEIPIFVVAGVVLLGVILCAIIPKKTKPKPRPFHVCFDGNNVDIVVISQLHCT